MKHVYAIRCTSVPGYAPRIVSFTSREEASKCIDYLIQEYEGHRFRVCEETVYDSFDLLESNLGTEITLAMDNYYDNL